MPQGADKIVFTCLAGIRSKKALDTATSMGYKEWDTLFSTLTTSHILLASLVNSFIIKCPIVLVLWKTVSSKMHFQRLLYYSFPVFSIFQVDGKSGWKMNNWNDPETREENNPDTWWLKLCTSSVHPQEWHQSAQQTLKTTERFVLNLFQSDFKICILCKAIRYFWFYIYKRPMKDWTFLFTLSNN